MDNSIVLDADPSPLAAFLLGHTYGEYETSARLAPLSRLSRGAMRGPASTLRSRWAWFRPRGGESFDRPQARGTAAERLLRLRVACGQPVNSYLDAVAALDKQERSSQKLIGMRLTGGKKGWEPAPVVA